MANTHRERLTNIQILLTKY
uniref:Uncharacterized protein n=1 Tax=Anguilla anguilla TaxID=7936 RepID=A0A0E9UNY6_ANGAN